MCQFHTFSRKQPNPSERIPTLTAPFPQFFSVASEATTSSSASPSSHKSSPAFRSLSVPTPPVPSSAMLVDSPPGVQLRVPNGHSIFGIGVGVLAESGAANGTSGSRQQHRRSVFARQISKSPSEEADRKKRLTMPLIYRMYESQSEELCGTVRGPDDEEFHPEEASKQLRQALAGGIQSHDQTLIDVLLAHNNFQRQKIAAAYENMFGRVLADDIEEEAGGHFMETILALLAPAHVYSARTLFYTISGKSFERSAAVELGLTSTASQLKVIRDTYQSEFRVLLERDLGVKVEGLFGKMLAQLLLRNVDFDNEVDVEAARQEADSLFNGNVEELGRSMDLFNRVFGLRSASQIRAFVERYDQRAKEAQGKEHQEAPAVDGRRATLTRVKDFEFTIRKSVNIHSDVKQAILLYVRIAKNMQLYFAEKLHEAVSQSRPDHSTIIRIVVSRSEIDLYDICAEYKRKYGRHLAYDLKNMCSGDFLRLLGQLVNPADVASGDEVFES